MPKSKLYNVQKAFKKNDLSSTSSAGTSSAGTSSAGTSSGSTSSKGTMTLKKKDKIKSTNNKESPDKK